MNELELVVSDARAAALIRGELFQTGIPVRAKVIVPGQSIWGTHDLVVLDPVSLLSWLRATEEPRGRELGPNRAERVLGILLSYTREELEAAHLVVSALVDPTAN